ncbi:hypothetical protein ACHQM5_010659 [Ranunculus cassubicifolius]
MVGRPLGRPSHSNTTRGRLTLSGRPLGRPSQLILLLYKILPIPSSQCCIFRIPQSLRILSEEAYIPNIVSIGPLHHDKECVKAMDEHKKWYLHSILHRTPKPDNTLKDFLKTIQAMEVQIRASYSKPIDLSSDDFVEMILLDSYDNYPIYITSWMLSSLKHDIILLENQLPFFALQHLFDMIRDSDNDLFLEEYVQYFFRDVYPQKTNHLLDLLRNHFFQCSGEMEAGDYRFGDHLIESATELANAGMQFVPEHYAGSLLDITFNKNGVFRIPLFFLADTVSYLLGNLIALEQCDNDYDSTLSSYIILLDSLINTPRDVRLLRREAILDSFLRDDEQVFRIIKRLGKGVIVSKFHFAKLCRQVNAYYESDWRKWPRANLKRNYVYTLKRDYFNTPWAFISFVAATMLLLLTLVQTLFTVHTR